MCQNQPSLFSSPQMLVFLKGFTEEDRTKRGPFIGVCLTNGLGEPTCLPALFEDHLVTEGELPRSVTRLQSALLSTFDISYFLWMGLYKLKKSRNKKRSDWHHPPKSPSKKMENSWQCTRIANVVNGKPIIMKVLPRQNLNIYLSNLCSIIQVNL